MLDENLPAFFLRPSTSGEKHNSDFYLSYHGSDPAPAYSLRRADPAAPTPSQKNCYAAALFDSYNPDICFGEVLARPSWTQPTLSQEEIRRNAGVPPPPQPILPTEFVIQLYNPDQQIRVELKEGKWGASDSYEFSMPISTFRTPSASHLDRGQSDPANLNITPKVHFIWRRESKLSKDLTCWMTGRSTDSQDDKKKRKAARKESDIAIALWRNLKEMTIYESNMSRLEMEDPKGLEVVLLLSAVVIKDLYLGAKDNMHEIFNITDAVSSQRKLSGGGRRLINPMQTHSIYGPLNGLAHHPPGQMVSRPNPSPPQRPNDIKRNSLPRLNTSPPGSGRPTPPPQQISHVPPPADPRQQWEIDAETAILKAQVTAEDKATQAAQQRRLKQKEKEDEAERKRLIRIVEEEHREARRRQLEVDKETERLRKKYGVPTLPQLPQRSTQANSSSYRPPSQSQPFMQPFPQLSKPPAQQQPKLGSNGLYIQPSASSHALTMSGANPSSSSSTNVTPKPAKKKSFFGLKSLGDDLGGPSVGRLAKKQSTMW